MLTQQLLRIPARSPHACRRRADARLCALIIGFGRHGYVALFRIKPDAVGQVLAVRHQREADHR